MEEAVSRFTPHASAAKRQASRISFLTVIQDRLSLAQSNRARFIEACEQAYHFGKGKLAIRELPLTNEETFGVHHFSDRLHCAQCDIEYRDPSPALFSFNNPVGACPACRGFGRIISIDYSRALPDRSKTLAGGVVKPWQTGHGLESQNDLLKMCHHFEIPTNVPFDKLPKKWQDFVIEGEPDYGTDEEHEWPRAWYGIKGYFRWLESKAYKMHVRVLLSRYRAYTTCPTCHGKRFQPETLLYLASIPAGRWDQAEGKVQYYEGGEHPGANDASENGQNMENVPAQRTSSPQPSPPEEEREKVSLADFYQLPIRDALQFLQALAKNRPAQPHDPLTLILSEVSSRLSYLNEVGLGYLTLDRPTRSLSGGETERVSLTTCLGTRLVNTLFVLDEPSVGLHPRDTDRLVRILQQLRNAGNTVVVVEHEPSVMAAGDQLVDLGPGHGASGGEVVFQGSYRGLLRAKHSITGQYLSGRKQIEIPERRPVRAGQGITAIESSWVPKQTPGSSPSPPREESAGERRPFDPARSNATEVGQGTRRPLYDNAHQFAYSSLAMNDVPSPLNNSSYGSPFLKLAHVTKHNLSDLSVEVPLGRFVCVTGVSGSGKTTLVREILLPALQSKLNASQFEMKASDRLASEHPGDDRAGAMSPASRNSPVLEGWESLGRVMLVDQSILGKTPRSNPAVYIGAFDDIREFFAQSEPARQRGLNASAFSFNSNQGQCQRCRGAGFEKIEMQFLSDVFIRCPECNGRRYRRHILDVRVALTGIPSRAGKHKIALLGKRRERRHLISPAKSIADLLESTIEEAIAFLTAFPNSRPAQRAVESLGLLAEVGLGYLKLGQPINTLSGGESQRLKLVRHLAESDGAGAPGSVISDAPARSTHHAPFRRSAPDQGGSRIPYAAPIPNFAPSTLFLFDEPTTGLHFEDVRV